MNDNAAQVDKQLRTLRIIAIAMLVLAPIAYLIVGQIISETCEPQAGQELVVYLLIMVAIGSPALVPIIVRSQVQSYRSNPNSSMAPINLFMTTSIVGIAVVEAVYIYGLVAFILTGEVVNQYYFYPVGIIWSFVYWPKRAKYENLLERLNRP